MTEEINKGCEFQSDCIEYKDISYLKIMPICAIHELSIACHDKVNKCKYYKLYKQLKRLEQENKDLKDNNNRLQAIIDDGRAENKRFREENKELLKYETYYLDKYIELRDSLKEIKEIVASAFAKQRSYKEDFTEIENIINEVLNLS